MKDEYKRQLISFIREELFTLVMVSTVCGTILLAVSIMASCARDTATFKAVPVEQREASK